MLSDILDGFGLPFSTNLLFITKTIKPQCVRSSAYKWMWRQKYSDLLVMVKVFMVLRKEKRRRVDAETPSLLEIMHMVSPFAPILLDLVFKSYYISTLCEWLYVF